MNVPPQPTPTPQPASSNSGTRVIFVLFLILIIVGGLNWGLIAIDKNLDLVEMLGKAIQGTSYSLTSRVVYGLVGISAVLVALLSAASSSSIYATN